MWSCNIFNAFLAGRLTHPLLNPPPYPPPPTMSSSPKPQNGHSFYGVVLQSDSHLQTGCLQQAKAAIVLMLETSPCLKLETAETVCVWCAAHSATGRCVLQLTSLTGRFGEVKARSRGVV